jgi:hypothetical protein
MRRTAMLLLQDDDVTMSLPAIERPRQGVLYSLRL